MRYRVSFEIDLKRNPYKGKYIALEGIDGAGKSTQVEKLARHFEAEGKEVVITREPRKEGVIGDIVQEILTGKTKVPSQALQYLFSTDRVIHHAEVIEPSLEAGKIVISDRCFWSAIPYGILDKDLSYDDENLDFLLVSQSILSMYHQFIVPDFTFVLKVSLDLAMQRISGKDDKKEIYEQKEKLKKINEGYNWIAEKFPNEITSVDGEGEVDDVTKRILQILTNTTNFK